MYTKRDSAVGMRERLGLLAIILGGLALRTASWRVQGFRGSHESEFETMARLIVQGDWAGYLSAQRAHQPVYALLLTPVYLFRFDLATYTYVLHSCLASGTIYLAYRISHDVFGPRGALASASLVAANLMIALWFPWITGDAPFHFFYALLALGAVKAWASPRLRSVATFGGCALLCALTRPEGSIVVAVASAVLLSRMLPDGLPRWKTSALILVVALSSAVAFTTLLSLNRPFRESFFSSISVAYPLYISTQMSTNSPGEQEKAYSSVGAAVADARRSPGFVNDSYALSMAGLRFIRDHPVTWGRMYVLRLASIVFPSVFSPWWSARNRLYSFFMSFLLVVGSLLACYRAGPQRTTVIGLAMVGFTVAFVVSLFQREMDHRVPVSMDIILACLAPFGWLTAFRREAGRGPIG